MLPKLKELFGYSDVDEKIINNEINQDNLDRIFYLGIISTPAVFVLVLLYYLSLNEGTLIEYQWRLGILYIHSVLFVFLLIGSIIAFRKRRKKSTGVSVKLLINISFFVITIAGVATAVLDQLVTPSILPYLLTCTVTALIILVRPFYSFLYFSISYVIICVTLSFSQHNKSILLSNRLDALFAVAIGFMLSLILWKNNLIRYRQRRLIETQKKEIENHYEKLVKYSEDLSTANAAKNKFFSIIAHDLRGPITSTISATEILLDQDYTPDEKNSLIVLLNSKLKKTHRLLENLLTWSKSQVDQISYNPKDVNLHSIIEENIELLSLIAQEKNIALINKTSQNYVVIADVEMSNTVLRNLISNAIKFTGINGIVEIDAKMHQGKNTASRHLEISIKDSGVGISEHIICDLFRIDKKTYNLGTNNESGSGLGLILCKDFIEKQGGKIWITSELTKGSCFTFTLPVFNSYSPTGQELSLHH